MNGIHPKPIQAVLLAALAAWLGVAGCSNQPGALKNPFSTVDRVPPPSTRVAPGSAAGTGDGERQCQERSGQAVVLRRNDRGDS
jgi:hypothetical protein